MTRALASELAELIAAGEGGTVEFKRSLTKDVGRGLCAFANAGGGRSCSASRTPARSSAWRTTTD